MASTGERENAVAVRRMWERFEGRKWDEAVSEFADDLVAYRPHTRETFRGARNFVDEPRVAGLGPHRD